MRTVHWPFLRAGLSYSFWVQPAVLFNRLFCSTGCTVQPAVLFNRLYCSTGCTVQPTVLLNRLYCWTGCTVEPTVLLNRLFCSIGCTVQPAVLFNRLYCWTGCSAQPAALFNTVRANPDLLTGSRLTKEDHEPWSVINRQTSTNPEHTCASVPFIAMELRLKCRSKWCLLYWWLTATKEQAEKPNFEAVAVCRPIAIMPTNVSVPNKFPQRVFIRKINPC
jgi:ADP-glucose pyrophosphorylase